MQKQANIHLLLDTHVFIWLMNGKDLLPSKNLSLWVGLKDRGLYIQNIQFNVKFY